MAKIPFHNNELRTIKHFPVVESDIFTFPGVFTDKLATPITPRENWELFFNRAGAQWVPDINFDWNYIYAAVNPDSIACGWDGGLDAFGCKWVPDTSAPNLPAFPEPGLVTLKDIADWRDLKWPNPAEWDWGKAAEEYSILDKDRINAVFLWTGLFERMVTLMTFENAAMALLEDPDACIDFVKRLEEFNISLIEHAHKDLNADVIVFSDDWGSQKAPFFSPDLASDIFSPHIQALTKRTHELGMKFMHHCCGNSTAFVPVMIDEGVDWWQCNYEAVENTIENTINKYGDKILFDAYPGFARALPDDDEEFKTAAKEYYRRLGAGLRCSLGITDDKPDRSFDVRKFLYQIARETAIAEKKDNAA